MYEKTNWQDRVVDPSTGEVIQEGTLISAGNLNHLENGVFQNSSDISTINGNVSTINNNISSINTSVAQNTSDISTNAEDIQDLSDHIATQDAANESKFDSIDTEIENIKKRLDPEPSPSPEPETNVEYIIDINTYTGSVSRNYQAPGTSWSGWKESISSDFLKINYKGEATAKTSILESKDDWINDWKHAFFMPKPCMYKNGKVDYYLNPENYEYKIDGTKSDIYNSNYDGDAVMEFPLTWIWIEPKSLVSPALTASAEVKSGIYGSQVLATVSIHISDNKINENYKCYPFINENGEILKHIYFGIFRSNSYKKSIAGLEPNVNVYNDLISSYDPNNPEKTLMSFTDYSYINFLMIMIGGGFISRSDAYDHKLSSVNGISNSEGLFGDHKMFGMENFGYNELLNGVVCQQYSAVSSTNIEFRLYLKQCLSKLDGSDITNYSLENFEKYKNVFDYYSEISSFSPSRFFGYSRSLFYADNILFPMTFPIPNVSRYDYIYDYNSSEIKYGTKSTFLKSYVKYIPENSFTNKKINGLKTNSTGYFSIDALNFDNSGYHRFVIRPTDDSEKYVEGDE